MNELPLADERLDERRVCPRFSPPWPLRVDLNSMGAEETFLYTLDCVDISESGLRVKCSAGCQLPFVTSSLIEAHVAMDNDRVSFLTKLQRDKEQADSRFLALRIVQIAVRDRELLRRMIHSHLPADDLV